MEETKIVTSNFNEQMQYVKQKTCLLINYHWIIDSC